MESLNGQPAEQDKGRSEWLKGWETVKGPHERGYSSRKATCAVMPIMR